MLHWLLTPSYQSACRQHPGGAVELRTVVVAARCRSWNDQLSRRGVCRVPLAPRSRRGGSSVASSFWRPPREDRTDALSVIDERFQKLALEYEDDDIGDLEDETAEARARAPVGEDARVQAALDDYLQNYRSGNEVVRAACVYTPWRGWFMRLLLKL